MLNSNKKKILKILLIISLIISLIGINLTYADDKDDLRDNINKLENIGYNPGVISDIFIKIIDGDGYIKNIFLSIFESSTEGYIPFWQDGKLKDSIIYSTGGKLSLGTETPREMLTVKNGISIGKDPNSDDDVGNRGFNDGRYVNVGEEIDGDLITDGTIDSTEIENNSIGEEDISDSFIARNSDLFDNKNSTGTVTDSDDWIPTSKAVVDYVNNYSSTANQKLDELSDAINDEASIFIGDNNGLNDDGQNYNIGIGYNSLVENVGGENNIASIAGSLESNISGNDNIALGNNTLQNNITGNRNISLMRNSLISNTGGSDNVVISSNAGYKVTGSNNIAFGLISSRYNDEGSNNIGFGRATMYSNDTGSGNIGYGRASIEYNTIGKNNIGYGGYSVFHNEEGDSNIGIGWGSIEGHEGTSYSNNIGIGSRTLEEITEGDNNIFMGYAAGNDIERGASNVFLGCGSMERAEEGSKNVGVGSRVLYNSGDSNNVLLGNKAGYNEDGSGTLYISNNETEDPLIYGDFIENKVTINDDLYIKGELIRAKGEKVKSIDELKDANTGPSAIYMGTGAGINSDENDDNHEYQNVGLGINAFNLMNEGEDSVAIGYMAGYKNTNGSNNTIVGTNSFHESEDDNGNDNTGLGGGTLYYLNGGDKNLAIGYEALNANDDGIGNIAIGYHAGYRKRDSDRLYIDNISDGNGSGSLIGGRFDKDEVYINGSLTVGVDLNDSCLSDDDLGIIKYIDEADEGLYGCYKIGDSYEWRKFTLE